MSYRLVIDYGSRRDYIPFQTEWVAKLRCRNFRSAAKANGSTTRFYVESGDYVKNAWHAKEVIL